MSSLSEGLRSIHQAAGLEFPFNEGSAFEHIPHLPSLMRAQRDVRRGIYELVAARYPTDSDVVHAVSIFNEIAPEIDLLFTAHVFRQDKKHERGILSWADYDYAAAKSLQERIGSQLVDPRFRKFFERNQETREILEIIANKVIWERDPEKLDDLTQQMEILAVQADSQGKLVFLFCLFDYHTNPNGFARPTASTSKNRVIPVRFEPEAQLILPLDTKKFDSLLSESWQRLKKQYPFIPVSEKPPPAIIGAVLGWAGGEIISYTTGQTLNSEGFMLGLNLFKHERLKQGIFRLLDNKEFPEFLEMQVMQYILHEYGHEFYLLSDKRLLEVAADMSMLLTGTEMILQKKFEAQALEKWITTLLIEYTAQGLLPETGIVNEDSYLLSGHFVINKLFEYGLVTFTQDKKIAIHPELTNVTALLSEIRPTSVRLLNNDKSTIDVLCDTKPSQATEQFLILVKQQSAPAAV